MSNMTSQKQHYKEILADYINKNDEKSLYQGQKFSRELLKEGVPPEEVVHFHIDVLLELFPHLDQDIKSSFDFLLEIMMDYGFAYRAHQSLKHKQEQLNLEIDLAVQMQETLLAGSLPSVPSLDVGAISKPAKKMNGDYYHFAQDENDCISVAVADVIGKGIPATLYMSMIKYALDSIPEQRKQPGALLERLNRVVEKSIDDSMFITMFYGSYDPRDHHFSYASAGHEPGFIYRKETDQFTEFSTKGLVLGVQSNTGYPEYELTLEIGDMIVLLSDGVTECRSSDGLIERAEVVELIQKYKHLTAQEIVENVYSELEHLQDFQLNDDITLIVFRRKE